MNVKVDAILIFTYVNVLVLYDRMKACIFFIPFPIKFPLKIFLRWT